MNKGAQFRLRWKGSVTGPFALNRILEMLRNGEISLLHNIEVEGSWMTLRDYFRATGLNPNPNLASEYDRENPPPPPGSSPATSSNRNYSDTRNQSHEILERFVLEGYFWCGATFLLPPLFALLVWLWVKLHDWTHFIPETPALSQFVLLTFTTFVGGLTPIYFVRKLGKLLEPQGLGEIRQNQERLVYILATFGITIWLIFFWYLSHSKA